MPSWAIHLAVSKQLSKNLEQKQIQPFTFGNLLPDVNNGYLIPNVSKVIPHDVTHYNLEHYSYRNKYEAEKLLQYYQGISQNMKEQLQNPVFYGYFVHILTDYYWNYSTYVKKGVFDNQNIVGLYKKDNTIFFGDSEEMRKIKVRDFNRYSKFLYENEIEKVQFTSKDLKNQAEQIKTIYIDESDINKVNQYFNQIDNTLEKIDNDFELFTLEELQTYLKGNIDFIKQFLNQ